MASPAFGTENDKYCTPNGPTWGEMDGPAHLPVRCMVTNLVHTPSPNRPTRVAPGGLEKGLRQAHCGDVLELEAGATYDGSNLIWPAHHCDDQHWITVRTSTPDRLLPPEGARMTPCWSGVASLPGRPPFACPPGGPQPLTANIVIRPPTMMKIQGDHYRLIGLQITRSPGGTDFTLVATAGGTKIIFDRLWVHGTATDETARGIWLSDSNQVAVIDSYFSDFHCVAMTGACVDSQAISGGSTTQAGYSHTWKIVDDFLEAAGESVIFGGGRAVDTPGDIEIRRNHLFKPMTWYPADPGYIGIKFIVKNNGELKNAQRVLFEGNIHENVWGGFSQNGTQMVITPKNQGGPRLPITRIVRSHGTVSVAVRDSGWGQVESGEQANIRDVADPSFDGLYTITVGNGNEFTYPQPNLPDASSNGGMAWMNLCPICKVQDVTVRDSYFTHSASGIAISNSLSDNGGPPANGGRYSLHDLIFDNMDVRWGNPFHTGKGGNLFAIHTDLGPNIPLLHDVIINHITGLQDSSPNNTHFMMIGAPATGPMRNFAFLNSIVFAGQYPVGGSGGGPANCAFQAPPVDLFQRCFSSAAAFTSNVIIGTPAMLPPSRWPRDNFFPSNPSAIEFVNFNGGIYGDYRLCHGQSEPASGCNKRSPYAGRATDGKDIGADVTTVKRSIAAVE